MTFNSFNQFFSLEFSRVEGGQKGGLKITKRQKEVLKFIEENPDITREILANKVGINNSAVQKHINALKVKKVIVRIGGDRGGHWEIIAEVE